MRTRILVGVIGLPLLLFILLVMPTIATALLVAAMSVIAVYELLHQTGLVKDIRLVGASALMGLFICLWSSGQREWGPLLAGVWVYFMLLFGLMIASHAKLPFAEICIAAFAGIVIPMLLSSLTRILTLEFGRYYILIPLILSFGTDSTAYFVGMAFGRHKMAPIISPKKSWEGAAGGVLGGMLLMFLYALLLSLVFDFEVNYGCAVLYGMLGAVTCVLGDLVFSVIKRQTGIKDYGNLLPGHGGILDRFDSMTLVASLSEVLILMLPLMKRP